MNHKKHIEVYINKVPYRCKCHSHLSFKVLTIWIQNYYFHIRLIKFWLSQFGKMPREEWRNCQCECCAKN